MKRRLAAGDAAPTFRVPDWRSIQVDLRDFRGRWLLLSFYRYASCPLCNLRVHELSGLHTDMRACGLDMLAVFQSPGKTLERYVGSRQPPFPLIADLEQVLYRLYGVGHSWAGFLVAWGKRLPEIARAVLREGYLPGSVEGGIHRTPADFLIGPDGRIAEAYYGRDIGDHLPIPRIRHHVAKKGNLS